MGIRTLSPVLTDNQWVFAERDALVAAQILLACNIYQTSLRH